MTTRPGVQVTTQATPPSRGAPTDTGVWAVVGLTERGPVGRAVEVRNFAEFTRTFGPRVSYSLLHDSLETYFREGGAVALVSRVVGPAATTATLTLNDAATTPAPSLGVDALGPGASTLSIEVTAGELAGTFRLIVRDGTTIVEASPELSNPEEAVGWASRSHYIRIRALGTSDPAVRAATTLVGGNDDRAAVTDAERIAGLEAFPASLGTAQVSIPGATTTAVHQALLTHAAERNRIALLDAPDTASSDSLMATALAMRTNTALPSGGQGYGAPFAPWVIVPGITRSTTRTVPPSALVAGLMARNDATQSPNEPAAGRNGQARWAIGLSRPAYSEDAYTSLNEAGVNMLRMVYGTVRLYGYRTLAGPSDQWRDLNHARLRMAIVAGAQSIAESFLFAMLDGRGRKVAEFGGALDGFLRGFWTAGALHGDSELDAYLVDVGPSVNTPETLAANELHAVVGVRMSPFAEFVSIVVTKVSITSAL